MLTQTKDFSQMRILCLSAQGVFSGFESTFFNSLIEQGHQGRIVHVESEVFKALCTLRSVRLSKSRWGLKRDLLYHASSEAFKVKSRIAQKVQHSLKGQFDLIYQIGALWNPIPSVGQRLPVVLQLDYTTRLSEERGSEWKRQPGHESEFWFNAEKQLYSQVEGICASTRNARDSLVNDYGVRDSKVVVVGAGVSGIFADHSYDQKPDYRSKRILFVGKGYKGKGVDTLLKAFAIVREKEPEARLTIIGPSQVIRGPGIEYLYREDDRKRLRDFFYSSSIFVMPSIFEPFGQVFLEAMSCQLPCIGTTLDAMPEIIDDGITGFTIEPSNHIMLAERMLTLLRDAVLTEKMGEAGYEKLKRQFVWPVVGQKIASVCKAAIKTSGPS